MGQGRLDLHQSALRADPDDLAATFGRLHPHEVLRAVRGVEVVHENAS
jgi:hypothetical protein